MWRYKKKYYIILKVILACFKANMASKAIEGQEPLYWVFFKEPFYTPFYFRATSFFVRCLIVLIDTELF